MPNPFPNTVIIEPLEAHCEQCTRDFTYRPSRGEHAQRSYPGHASMNGWYCPDCHQDNLNDIAAGNR